MSDLPASVDVTQRLLAAGGYVADRALATTVHLALRMGRPLFLEGEPGTGKTEIAKVLAKELPRRLVRLQCYDGLDLSAAAYEWNHAKPADGDPPGRGLRRGAGPRKRWSAASTTAVPAGPPAAAGADARAAAPAVLLIDELDRADEPFEAFLLEMLADFQLTVPEIGTIRATTPPVVIITSNRTREVHDAIRRRCLYHWVDYPDAGRERAILQSARPACRTSSRPRWSPSCRSCGPATTSSCPASPRRSTGRRADRARCARAGTGRGGRNPGRAAEVPGRHRQAPRRRGGAAGRRGQAGGGVTRARSAAG